MFLLCPPKINMDFKIIIKFILSEKKKKNRSDLYYYLIHTYIDHVHKIPIHSTQEPQNLPTLFQIQSNYKTTHSEKTSSISLYPAF